MQRKGAGASGAESSKRVRTQRKVLVSSVSH